METLDLINVWLTGDRASVANQLIECSFVPVGKFLLALNTLNPYEAQLFMEMMDKRMTLRRPLQ